MAPLSTPLSASPPSPGNAQDGGAAILAQSACGHVAAPEPVKPTGPAGSASLLAQSGCAKEHKALHGLSGRGSRSTRQPGAVLMPDCAIFSAHLDAGNPRGPDALSGERTFNDCGGASACDRLSAGTATVGQRPTSTAGNQSCPQSPSLGSGSLSTRPAAVPGSSLPEFRATTSDALAIMLAVPSGVIFGALVLFLFF